MGATPDLSLLLRHRDVGAHGAIGVSPYARLLNKLHYFKALFRKVEYSVLLLITLMGLRRTSRRISHPI